MALRQDYVINSSYKISAIVVHDRKMNTYKFSKQESPKNIGKANSLWKPDFLSVEPNCFCYKSHSIFRTSW